MSYTNSEPETKWKFFAYDKKSFDTALHDIDTSGNKPISIVIIDSLLINLEANYLEVSRDDEILSLYRIMSYNKDPQKYVGLYYERAKLKLSSIREGLINSNTINDDDFKILKEYYLRYKAAAFFKNTWFLINKYHVTQSFFNCFVDKKTFNSFFNPTPTTKYLNHDMYLNVILDNVTANEIINKIKTQEFSESDFYLNDKLFVDCLNGLLNKNYLVVYNFN